MIPRRSLLAALGVASVLLAGTSPAAAIRLLFVANAADDTVSVIDCDQDREIKVIPVGNAPQGLALRVQEPLVAVANAKSRFATLIDPVRLEALPEKIPTGMGPEDVVFSADGGTLLATSYYDKTVTFTDLRTRAMLGDPLAFSATPRQLLLAPDGKEFFVLLHDERGAIAVVDPSSRAVLATVPVGPFPTAMALTSDGGRLLAASFDATTITVVDVRSRTVVDTLSLDTGAGIALHPFKPIVYSMLNFDGAVLVADYASRHPVATVEVGGSPVAGVVTADGRFLYAVNSDASNATKIDTETNTAVLRIAVGADPTAALLFEQDGATGWVWRGTALAGAVVAAALAVRWRRTRQRTPRSAR